MSIDSKLDKVVEKQSEMNETLIRQEENLKEHMRRTEILEEKFEPVERHVAMIDGAVKLLGILGIVFGIYRSVN